MKNEILTKISPYTKDLCTSGILSRGLSVAATDGHVLRIEKGSVVSVIDSSNSATGTISGGYAQDGGAIDNAGTFTLHSGSITGNHSTNKGVGIWNRSTGTAYITGGSITDNTTNNGAGIYNEGTLWMRGSVTVTGNQKTSAKTVDNVFLKKNALIRVFGPLTGSAVGVSREGITGIITSGYSAYNDGADLSTVFTADNPDASIILSGTEACLTLTEENKVRYIERSWDADGKTIASTVKTLTNKLTDATASPSSEGDYKEITDGDDSFRLGGYSNNDEYYVVRGNVSRSTLNLSGRNVHLILRDEAKLTLTGGILMYGENKKLYIHSQSYGEQMGKLVAQSCHDDYAAGIGSDNADETRTLSDLEIHGGDIYAKGGDNAAGIGGGRLQNGGSVTIYGGKVEARGGANSAGSDDGYDGEVR